MTHMSEEGEQVEEGERDENSTDDVQSGEEEEGRKCE